MNINGNKIANVYTGNATIQIYGGTVVTFGIYGNQTPNAITGFKIGTSAGADDVLNSVDIGAVGTPTGIKVFGETILKKQFFNISEETTLYISATNWNGAVLGMTIFFESILG